MQRTLDLLPEDVLVEQVLDADADPVDLVGVRRSDPASGCADLATAEKALGYLVERAVVLGDHVGVSADDELRCVDATSVQRIQFVEKHLGIDDDAVGDDRYDALGEDAARQQVQRVLLVADDDGVAGVVAAVELDHVVDAAAEEVSGLALALIPPLGADDYDSWHGLSP